eukprot:COSAG06_NODE_4048_length_4633_cov_2.795545_2_plen_72_part_00
MKALSFGLCVFTKVEVCARARGPRQTARICAGAQVPPNHVAKGCANPRLSGGARARARPVARASAVPSCCL